MKSEIWRSGFSASASLLSIQKKELLSSIRAIYLHWANQHCCRYGICIRLARANTHVLFWQRKLSSCSAKLSDSNSTRFNQFSNMVDHSNHPAGTLDSQRVLSCATLTFYWQKCHSGFPLLVHKHRANIQQILSQVLNQEQRSVHVHLILSTPCTSSGGLVHTHCLIIEETVDTIHSHHWASRTVAFNSARNDTYQTTFLSPWDSAAINAIRCYHNFNLLWKYCHFTPIVTSSFFAHSLVNCIEHR